LTQLIREMGTYRARQRLFIRKKNPLYTHTGSIIETMLVNTRDNNNNIAISAIFVFYSLKQEQVLFFKFK
jgi:hypothetical protein